MNESKPLTQQNNQCDSNKKQYSKYLLPLIMVLAVIPFLVLIHKYNNNLVQYSWFSNEEINYDSYLYWKLIFLIITSAFMLLIIVSAFVHKKSVLVFKPIFIPIIIYIVLAIISTLCSEHISSSLLGSMDQFETIFALISYIIICYYTFTFVKTEGDIHFIVKLILIAAAISSVLGLTQIIGHDFWRTSIGQELILLTAKEDLVYNSTFELNRVYLSLMNSNYVGVYIALVSPIVLILILHAKKLKSTILYATIFLGLCISLVGSKSKTGMIFVAFACFIVLILSRKQIMKFKKIIIPALALCIIAGGVLLYKLDIFNYIINSFKAEKTSPNLTAIETNDENIVVHYKGNELKVSFFTDNKEVMNFYITDSDDNPVFYTMNEDPFIYAIEDERFPDFYLMPMIYEDSIMFELIIDGNSWYFTNQTGDNTYYAVNWFGKLCKFNNTSGGILSGHEFFASSRGYIWSRTLPLLKENIFISSGPDTFVFEFPNDDYVGFFNYLGDGNVLTKPHNLYLQIAVQTGVLSLICFIIFYLWYFINSVKLYIKGNLDTFTKQIGAGVFVGTFAYMLMGMLNDSSVTVAPIFWALLGLGIAINGINRREINTECKDNNIASI